MRGLDKIDAIMASGATASRAVLFSGIAFVVALFGMLLVPDTILRSLALGAIIVGVVSMLAALTLLPAVLSLLGDRVNALRIPVIGRKAISSRVREPLLVGSRPGCHAATAYEPSCRDALLLAAALPVLAIDTGPGLSTLPDRFPSKQGFDALNRDFPGAGVDPALIVLQGDVSSAPAHGSDGAVQGEPAAEDAFGAPITQAKSGDVVCSRIPLQVTPTGRQRRVRSATCAPT